MDYYQLLDIDPKATPDEIKKAYRKLVKVYHPDTGGDDNKFKQLSTAYETLSNPEKRKLYDLKIGVAGNPMDNWKSYFNHINQAFSGAGFSDAFDKTYGSEAKGPDVKIRFNLTLEEVYYGTKKYIDTGEGRFNIKIPRGIKNGAKLRIKNKGRSHPYNSSAPRGDVILIIQWLVDSELIVNGDDIWVELPIPFFDMLLGTRVDVKTKVNKSSVEIPRNAYDGQHITIAGGGMPIYNTNMYGNLIVKLIAKPVKLNEEQIKLVKKIKEIADV